MRRAAGGELVRERAALRDAEWPAGIAVFETVPLAEVIAAANRYGPEMLVLAGPELDNLKVSGRFRVNEPRLLAPRLAQMFGLRIATERGVTGVTLARNRSARSTMSMRWPDLKSRLSSRDLRVR